MRVLVACEESGVVRDSFIKAGHDAMSCDLQPSRSPGPHYQGDVRDVLHACWDLMIFHAPCTHICVSGAKHFEAKRLDGRQQAGISFFMELWRHGEKYIDKMAAEQPIGVLSSLFRKPDQIIQPWMFGHGETKATCLWLKNLPPPGGNKYCRWQGSADSQDATRARSSPGTTSNISGHCRRYGSAMGRRFNQQSSIGSQHDQEHN